MLEYMSGEGGQPKPLMFMQTKKEQPKTVQALHCSKYKELLVKVYPWARFKINQLEVLCGKCMNNAKK